MLTHIHNNLNLFITTATVVFDFDACDFKDSIISSVEAFTFTDELNSIIDANLNPVLDKAAILPAAFTDNIKSTIASAAEAKVNAVKSAVITQLNALSGCSRRGLGATARINRDGSQRMLTGGSTFNNLATSLEAVNGVVSLLLYLFCIFYVRR